ncbi:MAG: 50S ribosomal protein L29 [Planctomycetota bacterium]|nr:MAG: 50S ribosomal protein L29 [Planctomycetota bacterium]
MRTQHWREFTDDELREKLRDKIELLFKRRFETHDDQAKNPGEIRGARRDISKIRTVLRERELGIIRTGIPGITEKRKESKPAVKEEKEKKAEKEIKKETEEPEAPVSSESPAQPGEAETS